MDWSTKCVLTHKLGLWNIIFKKFNLYPSDLLVATALLSCLPIPVDHRHAGERAAGAAWAYPLIGAIIGFIAGLFALILTFAGVQPGIVAALALGCLMITTGGLHEDGLADCADGFGAGGFGTSESVERRLEIMKDSRVGAFGASALVLIILARWSAYEMLVTVDWLFAFIAVGAASRLPMVLIMFTMPLARSNGLAASVGQVTAPTAALATLLTLVICGLCIGLYALLVIVIAILGCLPLCALAWRRINGYTGDVLGGSQQLAELAALAALTAFL